MIKPLLMRFLSKVKKTPTCWVWLASKNEFGYGQMKVLGKMVKAHRISYEIFNGEIGNFQVLHRCDNPPCVNPRHLWLGTHLQNQMDKQKKGRCSRMFGEHHPRHKLTNLLVKKARRLRKSMSYREIGDLCGVSSTTISNALSGTTWSHLEKGDK